MSTCRSETSARTFSSPHRCSGTRSRAHRRMRCSQSRKLPSHQPVCSAAHTSTRGLEAHRAEAGGWPAEAPNATRSAVHRKRRQRPTEGRHDRESGAQLHAGTRPDTVEAFRPEPLTPPRDPRRMPLPAGSHRKPSYATPWVPGRRRRRVRGCRRRWRTGGPSPRSRRRCSSPRATRFRRPPARSSRRSRSLR